MNTLAYPSRAAVAQIRSTSQEVEPVSRLILRFDGPIMSARIIALTFLSSPERAILAAISRLPKVLFVLVHCMLFLSVQYPWASSPSKKTIQVLSLLFLEQSTRA